MRRWMCGMHNSTKTHTTSNQQSRRRIDKRSRKYRTLRRINKAASAVGQTRVTEYFEVLNEIEVLSAKNKILEENLHAIHNSLKTYDSSLISPNLTDIKMGILPLLMNSAKRNVSRSKTAYRYDDTMKMFMAYIKILGGNLLYQTLHANLPACIPSPSRVNEYIADKGPRVTEGLLRVDELYEYLIKWNLPSIVCIGEDGTGMLGKICYDPRTNKLVGFSLPLNDDGMPITELFMARNASEIERHFLNENNSVSTNAYTIMAQPLSETVPPFALTLFSTNNKFTALDVLRRWTFIRSELGKKGIAVLSFASDGDSRLLKAMKINTRIGTDSTSSNSDGDFHCEWFNCKMYGSLFTLCFQDMIHLLTKLRNRMLRSSAILPLGNGVVSKTFLKYLIDNISKDKHCLTDTDIEPKDRQNMKSAAKICEIKTQNCLTKYVPGS